MKKWVGFLVMICALLLCAFAQADQTISLTWDGETIGSVTVADDVTVYVEQNDADGISCEKDEENKIKTLTIQSSSCKIYQAVSAGTEQKVVILDMAWQNMMKDSPDSTAEVLMPNLHMGTVVSNTVSGTVRTMKISYTELENPDYVEGGNLVSEESWNEYKSYITEEILDFDAQTRQADGKSQNIQFEITQSTYKLKIYGNSELTCHVKKRPATIVSCHYTIDVDYDLRIDELSIETYSGTLKLNIPMEEFGLPLSFTFESDGEGAAGITFEASVGFTLQFDFGLCLPNVKASSRSGGKNPELIGECTIGLFAGIALGPEIDLLGVASIGIVYKMGYKLEYTMYGGHYFVGDDTHARWHACNSCSFLEICPQTGPLAIEFAILKVFSKELELMPAKKFDPVYEHYWSKTFNEDGEGHCPHVGYRLDVTVKDQNGHPLHGANISYDPSDATYFKPVMTAKTDANGEGTIYIPLTKDLKANTVTVTASIQDPLDPENLLTASASVTEKGIPEGKKEPDPETLSLTIDMKTCALYFKDSGSGAVVNMPSTIYYHPSKGKVLISNDIPAKSGVNFTEWNTAADGSGTAVAPGSQVAFDADTTLYAQWEPVSANYVVQFIANGGTSTTSTGAVVPVGQSLDISKERAYWQYHNFLGWALAEDAFEPDYPWGETNIVTNEQQGACVSLYAVWSFDPVNPPLCIHFDMNGGPEDQAPRDFFVDPNSFAVIPPQSIRWDEIHLLQGWSTDKNASEPEYYAARSYYFTKDLTLYAVWKVLPVCTLSFEDPAGKDTANMPEDILFAPDVSPRVSVPDTVPMKAGRHFVGWNTKADGSGKEIQPGAVILLYGDTTLYAQWEVIGNRWMARFNANGGESAPSPQFAKSGEAMILTTSEAVWTNHRFLGWSLTDDADTPEYPAGSSNVIPYRAGTDVVVLYAVWGFSPVDMPIRVSFDMNGGPSAQQPSDQWTPAGSWLTLSDAMPVWDGQHTFLGWGLSDDQAEYAPGSVAEFTEDTVLYAVWDAAYRLTEGDGSSWTKDKTAKTGLRFVGDGSVSYFRTLYVDGDPVSDQNYTLTSGSTVALLHTGYLNGLEEGSHRIRFGYMDGYAEGTFTVLKAVPRTGDSANPTLWIVLIVSGLAGFALALIRRRRK